MQYKPLYTLKQRLLDSLNMTNDHYYSVFCTYRFNGSMRAEPDFVNSISQIRRIQVGKAPDGNMPQWLKEIVQSSTECMKQGGQVKLQRSGTRQFEGKQRKDSIVSPTVINETPLEMLYKLDQNMLVASWIDDLGYPQKELEDKVLFYNSEQILNKDDCIEHFKKDKKKKFHDKNIEFSCKKGRKHEQNQDNFFVILEKKVKIMGVFDGHGINGHLMSSFTMGAMVSYIQNSKRFNEESIT